MIAYTAWYQRQAALKLTAVVKGRLGQSSKRSRTQRFAAFLSSRCGSGRRPDTGTNDIELDEATNRTVKRNHQWTTVHSFYVVMGGFVFDTSDANVSFLPNSRQRLTLTPGGLLYILEHEPDLIPDISGEHIWDKSKAGNLAKTIVCLQALWFCVQCISRLGQGLAISLLELNGFGHALCTLLMYCLWWDKPMDIEEPTPLRGEMEKEMYALMCMRSSVGQYQGYWPELPYGVRYGSHFGSNIAAETYVPTDMSHFQNFIDTYKHAVNFYTGEQRYVVLGRRKLLQCLLRWIGPTSVNGQVENADHNASHPVNLNYSGDVIGSKDETTTSSPSSTPAVAVDHSLQTSQDTAAQDGQSHSQDPSITTSSIDGLILVLGEWEEDGSWFLPWQPNPDYSPTSVYLSPTNVARWRLCASALQQYCPQPRWFDKSGIHSHQDFPAFRSVYDRSPDWPSVEHDVEAAVVDDDHPSAAIVIGFSFAGLVYGGLHLLAWKAPFPSQAERALWRSSGVILASSGFVVIFWILGLMSFTFAQAWIVKKVFWQNLKIGLRTYYESLSGAATDISVVCFLMPFVCASLAYIGARGYLVVESFLQLAHLPDSAYLLPAWSQYFPHIT
ncbi:hypothetical protein H2200_001885 [Cladophialophora chaetospira]|uniref:Uncharacterized protein n=1 Tax=Cladophialophora chaetospira TaxID=386627 RepID=A0AA38XMT0_9EURO|nr:hypothetical protein H2200_001885 [Cladophialophora chaetospira]